MIRTTDNLTSKDENNQKIKPLYTPKYIKETVAQLKVGQTNTPSKKEE